MVDQNYCRYGDVCYPKTLKVKLEQTECQNLAGTNESEACRGQLQRGNDQLRRYCDRFPGLGPNVADAYVQSGDPQSLSAAGIVRGLDRQCLRSFDRVTREQTQSVSRDRRSSADREQWQPETSCHRRPGEPRLTRAATSGTSTSDGGR